MNEPKVRITNISFDADETPSEVTVVLPIATAAWLAKHTGGLSPAQGSSAHSTALYDALTGRVFNAFWEDGVDDYLRSS